VSVRRASRADREAAVPSGRRTPDAVRGYALEVIELLLQADRLLTVDMVDQAEAIYLKVAEADPNNAIAVVGLARCALARADDHEAYRLAARALAIDPQNDMARRMERRLAEVLETRGEVPGAGTGSAVADELSPADDTTTDDAKVASEVGPAPAPGVRPAPPPAPMPRRSLIDRLRGR
jgi:tetratricopeptide (TPR) repeat protein